VGNTIKIRGGDVPGRRKRKNDLDHSRECMPRCSILERKDPQLTPAGSSNSDNADECPGTNWKRRT
jgi:hypothetical protein